MDAENMDIEQAPVSYTLSAHRMTIQMPRCVSFTTVQGVVYPGGARGLLQRSVKLCSVQYAWLAKIFHG